MEEAFDTAAGQVVSIADAVSSCLAALRGPHEFQCADVNCRVPVCVSSYKATNRREPYVASCRLDTCHSTFCPCGGKGAQNPVTCHADDCEYVEDLPSGARGGARMVKAAKLRLQAPTTIHVPTAGGGKGAPARHGIRIMSGSFTLYKLLAFLVGWCASSPHTVETTPLSFDKTTLPLPKWFIRPMDLAVNSPADLQILQQRRFIYFGFAKFTDVNSASGEVRVQFDGHTNWSGARRPLSLFTNSGQLARTRKRQRFTRMIDDIKASSRPDRCFAFVLGSINAAKHATFLNLDLGRGLEEVLLYPVSAAGRWRTFETLYKRVNGIP